VGSLKKLNREILDKCQRVVYKHGVGERRHGVFGAT